MHVVRDVLGVIYDEPDTSSASGDSSVDRRLRWIFLRRSVPFNQDRLSQQPGPCQQATFGLAWHVSPKVHIGVLVATVALVAYGAIIIWSASQFKADASFSRHLLGIGIGTVLAVLVWRTDLRGISNFRRRCSSSTSTCILAQDSGSVLYGRSGHDGLDQDSRYRLDVPAG